MFVTVIVTVTSCSSFEIPQPPQATAKTWTTSVTTTTETTTTMNRPQRLWTGHNGDDKDKDNGNDEYWNRKMHEKETRQGLKTHTRLEPQVLFSIFFKFTYYTNAFKILSYYYLTTATNDGRGGEGSRRRRRVSILRYVFYYYVFYILCWRFYKFMLLIVSHSHEWQRRRRETRAGARDDRDVPRAPGEIRGYNSFMYIVIK
jgi:hypothetical protein